MLIRRPGLELPTMEYILEFLKCQELVEAEEEKTKIKTIARSRRNRDRRKLGWQDEYRTVHVGSTLVLRSPSSMSERTFPPIHVLPTTWSLRKCEENTPGARAGRHFETADSIWLMGKEGASAQDLDVRPWDADSRVPSRRPRPPLWPPACTQLQLQPARTFFNVNSVLVCI